MAPISTILDENDRDDPNFFFENFRAAKIVASPKKNRDEQVNTHTNERTTEDPSRTDVLRAIFSDKGLMQCHSLRGQSF